jgi:nucleoprotein TPR
LQRARVADAERQQAAIATAVQKVKDETPVAQTAPADLAKQHNDQLRALQQRLTIKHQQELKAAVDAAVAAANTSAPAPGSGSEVDIKAAIAAAIEAHDKEFESQRAEEIAAAVERGRMEQGAKAKLKDQALVRAQSKLKELESRVLEWRKAGLIPDPPAPPAPSPTTTITSAGPSFAVDSPALPTSSVATGATLPRKPSLATPSEGVGRGRGAARGAVRGARGLQVRGVAPGRGAAPVAGTSGGVSILGAAGKRTREEVETPNDSLAKRLKPAESVGNKPVTLRRDRVPPP